MPRKSESLIFRPSSLTSSKSGACSPSVTIPLILRLPTRYPQLVLALHAVNAVLLIAANVLAFAWGLVYYRRGRTPGRVYAHLLALAQSLVIAQVALGLLLLSGGERTADKLHYLYGALALGAALSPWLYAPPVPSRRLLWFVGASLLASALSARAYTTAAP